MEQTVAAPNSPAATAAGHSLAKPGSFPQIERRDRLSNREFQRDYVARLRPVVLTHAIDHWPALGKWTPDWFRTAMGTERVTVDGVQRTFAEVLDLIEHSDPGKPAPYLREVKMTRPADPVGARGVVPEVFPELMADLRPYPPFCHNRLMSRSLPPRLRWPDGLWELLIGGSGARYPTLHVDASHFHAYLMQIHGQKEVLCFAPDQGPLLYERDGGGLSRIRDPFDFDQPEFPLYSQAVGQRTLLEPGDTMFIPCGWWHVTRMPSTSITVTTNTVTSSNWRGYSRDVCVTDEPRLKVGLKLAYMAALEVWLGLGEWLLMLG